VYPLVASADVAADDALPSAPKMVTADAQCQQSLTPTCLGHLIVKQGGQPAVSTAHISSAAPSTPPTCYYKQEFTYPIPAAVQTDGGPTQMSIQKQVCPDGATQVRLPLKFTPVSASAPVTDVRALVEQASKAMKIPTPQLSLSPDAASTEFVGVPVWAWTPSSEWAPKSVSVSAGGVSLTMTATPEFVTWSMGDGGSMTCWGAGTPYPTAGAKPPERSPDCGYTYAAPSSSSPGGYFPVAATTHWKVAWSTTTGLAGTEPELTASSSLHLRVSEIQALVTRVQS